MVVDESSVLCDALMLRHYRTSPINIDVILTFVLFFVDTSKRSYGCLLDGISKRKI